MKSCFPIFEIKRNKIKITLFGSPVISCISCGDSRFYSVHCPAGCVIFYGWRYLLWVSS